MEATATTSQNSDDIIVVEPQPMESSVLVTISPRRSATPDQPTTLAPQVGVDRGKAPHTSLNVERTT